MKTWALITVSLCAGCFVDRDIGPRVQSGVVARPSRPARDLGTCCTLGPEMALDIPDSQAGSPAIAWNGATWAVTWEQRLGLLSLPTTPDQPITPVIRIVDGDLPGALLQLTERVMFPSAIASDPPAGGYVLALGSSAWPERDPHGKVVSVDADGRPRASATIEGMSAAELVWSAGLQAWALVAYEVEDESSLARVLLLLDDHLRPLGRPVSLGRALEDEWMLNVLALEDQVLVVLRAEEGVQIRTFVGRELAEPRPPVLLDPGTVAVPFAPPPSRGDPPKPPPPVGDVTAALVGDSVVIAAMNARNVLTWSYQPATRTITDGPTVVGDTRYYGALGMGADRDAGAAAICFAVGSGTEDPDGLQLVLVGADGKPSGSPVTVARGLEFMDDCAVAAGHTDEFLVAYWDAAHISPPPTMLARRVHVQHPAPPVD